MWLTSFKVRIYIGIATIFMALFTLALIIVTTTNFIQSQQVAEASAKDSFNKYSDNLEQLLLRQISSAEAVVNVVASLDSLSVVPEGDGLSHPALNTLLNAVNWYPNFYGVGVGYVGGQWLQVFSEKQFDGKIAENAPEDARYFVRAITYGNQFIRQEYGSYLAEDGSVLKRELDEADYDPRTRRWYLDSLRREQAFISKPFVFKQLGAPGISVSKRLKNAEGAVGIGVTFRSFRSFAEKHKLSDNSEIFLFDTSKSLILHQHGKLSDFQLSSGSLKLSKTEGEKAPLNPLVSKTINLAEKHDWQPFPVGHFFFEDKKYFYLTRPIRKQLANTLMMAVVAPEKDFTAHIYQMRTVNVMFSVAALFMTLIATYFLSRRISLKLHMLTDEVEKISNLELERRTNVDSVFKEIHLLSKTFESMRKALARFSHYVPTDIVKQVLSSQEEGQLEGQRREVTVLFSDINNFTSISESTNAEVLTSRISDYFVSLGHEISVKKGIVDKYIGDAIMALWNAPQSNPDHVKDACSALLRCQAVSRELAKAAEKQKLAPFQTRFGLHTGEAIVGNVGGADRLNYTALGPSINLAARLEGLNKIYGTENLVSEAIIPHIKEDFVFRQIDIVRPYGVTTPIKVFELRAQKTDAELSVGEWERETRFCAKWSEILSCYQSRNWEIMLEKLTQFLVEFPEDKAAKIYLERGKGFLLNPPDSNWDGVTQANSK